ncbi:hypothetical protein ABXN37_20085 [Piscinibacter sakaiensis]|uniref:hypothetical protein n=1 Tax=Piscinibacter sakaiensis TaxID=1547922 RepID=UPI0037264680
MPPLDELARRACASDDDHVVKGVHACLDEARAVGLDSVSGRRFLRTAAGMLAA